MSLAVALRRCPYVMGAVDASTQPYVWRPLLIIDGAGMTMEKSSGNHVRISIQGVAIQGVANILVHDGTYPKLSTSHSIVGCGPISS